MQIFGSGRTDRHANGLSFSRLHGFDQFKFCLHGERACVVSSEHLLRSFYQVIFPTRNSWEKESLAGSRLRKNQSCIRYGHSERILLHRCSRDRQHQCGFLLRSNKIRAVDGVIRLKASISPRILPRKLRITVDHLVRIEDRAGWMFYGPKPSSGLLPLMAVTA